jgi:hypothetical protein
MKKTFVLGLTVITLALTSSAARAGDVRFSFHVGLPLPRICVPAPVCVTPVYVAPPVVYCPPRVAYPGYYGYPRYVHPHAKYHYVHHGNRCGY